MRKTLTSSSLLLGALLSVLASGCEEGPKYPTKKGTGETQPVVGWKPPKSKASMDLHLDAATDAARIQVVVEQIACASEPLEATIRIEKTFHLDNEGEGEDSSIAALDLAPGCYEVTAMAIERDPKTPSERCIAADVLKVVLAEGQKTEVRLVGPCNGLEARGPATLKLDRRA